MKDLILFLEWCEYNVEHDLRHSISVAIEEYIKHKN